MILLAHAAFWAVIAFGLFALNTRTGTNVSRFASYSLAWVCVLVAIVLVALVTLEGLAAR